MHVVTLATKPSDKKFYVVRMTDGRQLKVQATCYSYLENGTIEFYEGDPKAVLKQLATGASNPQAVFTCRRGQVEFVTDTEALVSEDFPVSQTKKQKAAAKPAAPKALATKKKKTASQG